MLNPRIIPCLLIKNKGLVKTIKFRDPKYVGDPINAVKIFNEKEVDELIVLDIDASDENREPDYAMIENLAVECRMPFCYGGGIKTPEQARRIFGLGVEKIAISSLAVENPDFITTIAESVGNQSVVVILDVKKRLLSSKYEIWINNARKNTGLSAVDFASKIAALGAGEIVINSIDCDGTMKGYDFHIIDQIRNAVNIPLTILGGVGSLQDIGIAFARYGIIGASAGSLFVFKGKFRAVLINYPPPNEKEEVIRKNLCQ
jgi:imidazole glycerol-phosphate synthase subunit HisF